MFNKAIRQIPFTQFLTVKVQNKWFDMCTFLVADNNKMVFVFEPMGPNIEFA